MEAMLVDKATARCKCESVKDRQQIDEDEFYRQGKFWKLAWNGRCQDIDMEQLAKGIEVEMEHTNSNIVATKIALDHLAEFPDYYDALEDMEKKMKKKWKARR
jgi:hypothetical protein